MNIVLRLLSFLWPIRVERTAGRHGSLDVTWENGRLVVNSARANQSFGGLHRVWQRSFRAMRLKERTIDRVLLLGLGAGSVIHILRTELGITAPIVAVDDEPEMLRLAREHFALGGWKDLQVIHADAFQAIQDIAGPFDLIAVDLFTEQDIPAGLVDPQVVARLAGLLSPTGLLMVNTIAHDQASAEGVSVMEERLRDRFTDVRPLRPLGDNVVFAAREQRS